MNRLIKFLTLIGLLFVSNLLFATHQRAGEITYKHITGLTYEFTIVTYTYTPSLADRPELEVVWGDGSTEVIERTNKVNLANEISKNTYVAKHTFPSSGSYAISLEDANRNAGIVNMNNSVNIPFFLETTLLINPFIGANSSPQLLNPPIDNGCMHQIYYHNPGAYDADGDSLSYALVPCRGYGGENIPGYSLPIAPVGISIDPVTGDLIWNSPQMQGEYNVAILITEWRNGVAIGTVTRDMQITIAACDNEPPQIITIDDTCILAGTTLVFDVTAMDANSSQVTLSATGGPFQVQAPTAVFPPQTDEPTFTTQFVWHSSCNHVRKLPYQVTFKAIDNGPQVNLVNFKTVNVRVVAPKPENLMAVPLGNEIHLTWSPDFCTNVSGYKIYKRLSTYEFEPDECETGLPSSAGYQLIGKTQNAFDTTFVDDGAVMPTKHGNEYCYRVVAFFSDGAESYVSDETCASILCDAPLLTHVDVDVTDDSNGRILVKWMPPTELDETQYEEFRYVVLRSSSETPSLYSAIDTLFSLKDTFVIDNYLNTSELSYIYKVDLWGRVLGEWQPIEISDAASSIFLSIEKRDRALALQWQENVPWSNEEYTIYRYNEQTHQYDSLTVTAESSYLDENLQNGVSYCYYVCSKGRYDFTDTLKYYFNRSQMNCEWPEDIVPPEVPVVKITTDCENVYISWHFSTDTSYYDVDRYYIYYKPTYQDDFIRWDSLTDYVNECYGADCSYVLDDMKFITGCFAMTTIDTNGNESALSETVCFDVDACMPYQLPNVFTPDGDGVNDLFQPFEYANVAAVDFTVYDRWGRRVFHTEDPDLNWSGENSYTRQKCSNGVYYYVCEVSLYTLAGIIVQPLHGSITLITGK
ncbi:MAG: gliding motility-associated C-terminal domain-containing protein [Bacteroidales bacterium]|nr:gliding motility-associated C-terminal domain-containing protein [Bacteroidales bacterium]